MDYKKMKNKKLILATHNDGKIKEFQNLMHKVNINIYKQMVRQITFHQFYQVNRHDQV